MTSHLKSIILCLLVLVSVTAFSQIPRKISYQGVLTLSAGTPATDGNYTLVFNIFENPTGGTSLYAETHVSVPVSRGTFKVILGSVTTLTLPFDRTYYLEMTVTAGPNITSSVAFPRTDFTSTPYALRADTAEFAKAVLGGTGNVTLPFPGTVDTNITPIDVSQNGIGGGINIQINNVSNNSRALNVATTGGNDAIYSQTLGTASAGNFAVNNVFNSFGAAVMATSNGSYTTYSQNNGNGSAGEFKINTSTSTAIALNTENAGTGYVSRFVGGNTLSKGVFIDINSAIDRAHLTLYEFENDYARLSFQNGSAEGYWTIAGVTNTTASNSRLNFYSSQLGADAMSITGSGNVGIGNGNPQYKLHVEGTVNATEFRVYGTPITSSQWTGSNNNIGYTTGNVGIGTTTPITKLHISDATNPAAFTLGVSATAGGYTSLLTSLSSIGGGYASLQAIRSAGSSWGDLILNKDGGNVGIGTTEPIAKLEVVDGDASSFGPSLKVTKTNSTTTFPAIWASSSATGPALRAYHTSSTGTALDIQNGAIKVSGAGFGTNTAVFIHQGAENISEDNGYTKIDNQLCNGDPNAILIVTEIANYSNNASGWAEYGSSSTSVFIPTFVVQYCSSTWLPNLTTAQGYWVIRPYITKGYNYGTGANASSGPSSPVGRTWAIMVIKP